MYETIILTVRLSETHLSAREVNISVGPDPVGFAVAVSLRSAKSEGRPEVDHGGIPPGTL